HDWAARGVEGDGGELPHLAAIQQSFGHHDVSGIRAHVGGAAAEAATAIGARAYATGNDVAFSKAPDVRQAAHEAAHVVQQREGAVQLDGGVGRSGDPYEQHADAVADAVVRGASAEALLDTMAHRGPSVGTAVQRLDSHDVVGNTLSATGSTRTGALDDRSQQRVFERIAELRGQDPREAGERFAAMVPAERQRAMEEAVTWFQGTEQGRRLVGEIQDANATTRGDGSLMYERPRTGALSRHTAPVADYTPGQARINDITMQALANAWPQTIFGRSMTEPQAYEAIRRMVTGRSLPFDASAINVVGMRAYQGGAIHDNGDGPGERPGGESTQRRVFTHGNRFDDATFMLYQGERGNQVLQSRATTDPGGEANVEFQVAADQQWDYVGNTRIPSPKYDRPMHGLVDDGAAPVQLGRYWREHPEEVEAAIDRVSHGSPGRLVRRDDGRLETDRANLRPRGETRRRPMQRMVSAVHSGGRGSESGEQTGGDSTGCTVIHGAWYAHFNETLRREAGGDRVRFTYSMIDPRLYTQAELDAILDEVVPRAQPAESSDSRTAVQRIDFDEDGQDDGEARPAAEVDRLVRDTLRAIAQNESGGAAVASESRMGTSAGIPASYGSSTQMTASHAVGVLRGRRDDSEGERTARREYAERHGLDSSELSDANDIMRASQRIWDAIVMHGAEPSSVDPDDRRLTRFTDEELGRMVEMRHVREALRAQRERFGEIEAAVEAWLRGQVERIRTQLDELATQLTTSSGTTAPPAAQAAA
ncbi:MAG: DUF4157 domain-containing protein, partial [Deltaproteobacteria bacterium]|nr:DUF4157 domain-containing protein [Kofleriaceae bacterium]